jgi:hypothetical protein
MLDFTFVYTTSLMVELIAKLEQGVLKLLMSRYATLDEPAIN